MEHDAVFPIISLSMESIFITKEGVVMKFVKTIPLNLRFKFSLCEEQSHRKYPNGNAT